MVSNKKPDKLSVLLRSISKFFSRRRHSSGSKNDLRKINLFLVKRPISEAIKAIEKQTDYTFIYFTSDINTSELISIHVSDETLEKTLHYCFGQLPITCVIMKDMIVKKFILLKAKEWVSGTQKTEQLA
jgi:hypothetical protein